MTKPQWLIDAENRKYIPEPRKCCNCIYYGKPMKETKYRDKERVMLYQCDLHPGTFNTKYSVCCIDYNESSIM